MVTERPAPSGAFIGTGLVVLALLAGCSSGGGGTPDVSFSFASAAATLLESDGPTDVTVVLHTTLPALDEDVTVEVVDLVNGTATSGADYAAFAPVTVTFLTGALEGATQTVTLDPLDDSLVDGTSETVRLRLQNPSRGGLASPVQFTGTLTDIHTAVVAFATTSATTPHESGGQPIAIELDCGPGVTLGAAVNVRVSDLSTGSALAGSDYSSFAAKTVTFSPGCGNAVQTVNLTVLDDTNLESDETVELGLSQPSTTCTLGAIVLHVFTITDDDGSPAEFAASEGLTGTENPLAYDEQISLGTQVVGAGPNVGTLVRVTNNGGTAMDLGTPSLAGSHPNDFVVEVESSSAPALGLVAPADAAAPMVALASAGPGIALRLDAPTIEGLGKLENVALHGFPLPDLGPVTVELERRPLPLAPDAKLVIDGQEIAGGVRVLTSDLQIWRGVVTGMPGSRVFLAISPRSVGGFFELPFLTDRYVHVTSDGPGKVRLVREAELAALGFRAPRDFCAGERFVPGQPVIQELGNAGDPETSALTVSKCTIAIESDFQFYSLFGSCTGVTSYVTGLIGAVSDQYFTDVQTTLSIAYLGIHTTSNDGWTTQETPGADVGDLLDEFQADWGTSWPAQANLAHFLSGDSLGGGVAYVDVLCNTTFGFGVSANMTGSINWLTWTGAPGNFTWDFVVVAHEIGHNFGSLHTHDYCPPLDDCYSNCTGMTSCPTGTIMSYCHACGGMANIDLYFHPVTANIMRQSVNASCLDDAALLPGDFVQYRVQFNPLTTTGARSATLTFSHDATNVTQPFRVRLAGTAN
jgi:hypothetical protein